MCVQRFQVFSRLEEELHEAKTALADRKVIERAKGILMTAKSLSEQDAYAMMRKAAMDQKRRLAEIARAIVMAEGMLK
jgi:response regulator NasT